MPSPAAAAAAVGWLGTEAIPTTGGRCWERPACPPAPAATAAPIFSMPGGSHGPIQLAVAGAGGAAAAAGCSTPAAALFCAIISPCSGKTAK